MSKVLRKWRLAMVFCGDIFTVVVVWFATFLLCTNAQHFPSKVWSFLPYLILIQGSCFYYCGLYRGIWRFASIPDLIRIIKSVVFGVLASIVLLNFAEKLYLLPPPIPIIYAMLLILFLSAPRVLFRWLKDYRQFFHRGQRVLIVGAGNAGEGLVRDLRRVSDHGYQPVAFVDDRIALQGKEIHGIRVKGTIDDIPYIVERLQIGLIFIALPSASSAQMRRVVTLCEQAKASFRTLPGLKELVEGRVSINELRDVSLEDLLGREQVDLAWEKVRSTIMHKSILVTGGGGSIGEELCMQIAALSPKELTIVENSEYNLYLIEMKLRQSFPNVNVNIYLTSVTDKQAIKKIFYKHKPQLVFHVAAYKHVPLLETNCRVAVYNNIIGTYVVAEAANETNVETFVFISTDKAVNPTNVMGATKRASEILCQNFNFQSRTNFITVRFGNVLESAGSVIPLFRKQLQNGGPITVTHPEMTRFFMTIPEACQLILQAASIGEGGEIFVLDMGEPVKIRYLAEQLIKLSGKTLSRDICIEYIGLRPGEKLYEELFYNEEDLSETVHPKIKKGKAQKQCWRTLIEKLERLESVCQQYDEKEIMALLQQLVPEYAGKSAGDEKTAHLQLVNNG